MNHYGLLISRSTLCHIRSRGGDCSGILDRLMKNNRGMTNCYKCATDTCSRESITYTVNIHNFVIGGLSTTKEVDEDGKEDDLRVS